MFLFYLFVLQSAVAASVQRAGEDVTLTCEHKLEGQRNCNGTSWYYYAGTSSIMDLVELGKIKDYSDITSDRVRVAADCSLILKKVTEKQVGLYYCDQLKSDSSKQPVIVSWSFVDLSIVNIVTEHDSDDEETLKCFVTSIQENCEVEVKWTIKDQDIDEVNSQIKTEKNGCSATVTLKKSHYLHSQTHFLSCEVTDNRTGETFRFSPRPSGDTKSTMKPESFTKSAGTETSGASAGPQGSWWMHSIVAVGLIVLLITAVVIIIRWKRTKGSWWRLRRDGDIC
ncbi:uncharacterized protein LOC115402446 isoform X2 [Salarias fasciatus]|uniref:uncharacterized protein LOC115402446 isoform X2 n=1 Tax=Salarias fasciatus TaxID=181472 RepID=UPI001176CE7E|nr:uncharacterized protein LOC115402446 isoform X2 [Salarias fasciatus]